METNKKANNQQIYTSLTALGVPPETAVRFLITYRYQSVTKFSKRIKVSHTAVLKALRGPGHKNVKEIIFNHLFSQ